jgi:hypothetical protein
MGQRHGQAHGRVKNLGGQHFGDWQVLRLASRHPSSKRIRWSCRCACGKVRSIPSSVLVSGHSKSCGCSRSGGDVKPGQVRGAWTVLARAPSRTGASCWRCRCTCGAERIVKGYTLRHGKWRSCGCADVEDLRGRKFGLWQPLRFTKGRGWLCRCQCGTERYIQGGSLGAGVTQSCGCARLRQLEINGVRASVREFAAILGCRANTLHARVRAHGGALTVGVLVPSLGRKARKI